MKLMNEVKAEIEAIVRRIHVADAPAGRVRPARSSSSSRSTAGPSGSAHVPAVLVANRGEIAVRVIRALHELGVEAVAVYSTADADALHVRLADEAVCIGPPAAAESYLRHPVDRRRRRSRPAATPCIPATGSCPRTRRSSRRASTTTSSSSGRRPTVMTTMGDKIAARIAMRAADVPTVPGTEGATTLERGARRRGRDRLPGDAEGVGRRRRARDAARRRPRRARGCVRGRVGRGRRPRSATARSTSRRCSCPARHVEIQVLCDTHGNVLTLGERECSIQRRHQKLDRGDALAGADARSCARRWRRPPSAPAARSAT